MATTTAAAASDGPRATLKAGRDAAAAREAAERDAEMLAHC